MPKPDIHQLEERVLALMGEFHRLRKENQRLSCQIDQLNREKEILIEEASLNQESLKRLSQLESLNRKNEKDNQAIRMKVQILLESLEKFDLD
ncbi:MAG: hypothetical protein CMH73_02535 [Nitrospina sp.]|jgi:predicted RNase H-like nuclease (RuvC/YqgF family)|nr:hypothetical protein [Nitrospina sp.]